MTINELFTADLVENLAREEGQGQRPTKRRERKEFAYEKVDIALTMGGHGEGDFTGYPVRSSHLGLLVV